MGDLIPFSRPDPTTPRVPTDKTCTGCGEPIGPGTLYVTGKGAVRHVACPTRGGTRATFYVLRATGGQAA